MPYQREAVVYKITNQVNGKVYIGQTIDWRRRLRHHRKHERLIHLRRAYEFYGLENFLFEIVETFDPESPQCQDQMNLKERLLIAQHQSNDPNLGYNKTEGGKKYFSHSTEARKKISIKTMGKKTKDSTRKLLSEAHNFHKKKVLCVELNRVFESICEASRDLKIRKGNITSVLSGRQNRAGGFHWREVLV